MGKLVVFEMGKGDFQVGFPVRIKIGEEGQPPAVEINSETFPPAPKIPELYKNWQLAYRQLGKSQRIILPKSEVTHVSTSDDFQQATAELKDNFSNWLYHPSMRRIEWQLLRMINTSEEVKFILQTQDALIRRLPWHLWDFLQICYPHAEIALSAEYEPSANRLKNRVKILVVLGNSAGINVQQDLNTISMLPGTQIELLKEPTQREFIDKLRCKPWDMLFFAGHSYSQDDDNSGIIQINQNQEILQLDNLYMSLRHAVTRGLKLAFFNSCDGMGLAKNLADVKIPYVIVMREPVPDQVAQNFLHYFLTAFSHGEPFYASIKQARERLQEELEDKYPCASWLPIVFQNPAAVALKWPKQRNFRKIALSGLAIIGISLTLGKIVSEFMFWNRTSYGEKILVKANQTVDKAAGVRAFSQKDYSTAVLKFARSLEQNRNDPETVIYQNNAEIGDRAAFSVAVSVPIGNNPNIAQEILQGIAQAQTEVNHQGGIHGKALKIQLADDKNDINIAQEIAHKLVEHKEIIAVIGHNASDVSVVVAPIYQQGKLVMISSTSFSQKLTEVGSYIFRTTTNISYIAESLVSYILKNSHTRNLAICVDKNAEDNRSFSQQIQTSVYKVDLTQWQDTIYKYEGEIIDINCDFSDDKFNPEQMINLAVNKHINGLVLAPHVDRINKALDLAKANQGRLTLFASPTLYTSVTLQARKDVNGMILSVPWHYLGIPGNPFARKAEKLWGVNVNWRTALSYDSVIAIATALKKSNTREELQQTLKSPDFSAYGATGTISFQPSGDRKPNNRQAPAYIVKVQPSSNAPTGYDFIPVNP